MIDSGTLLQGRFLIEEKIGVGGMGAVYRAVDQKFGSRVAIKETFYGDTNLAEAFEREARLLNGLHHAILPHVSDHFTENGGHFLVMEYIGGEDLSEILKRGEVIPVSTALAWALDLLDGLDYLHSQDPPVIHRDIKPNNLKLTSRGKIMLLDFGMAKETSSNTLGAQSVFGYSRRYSPLEQIEGTGTDVRSDIFSLGASIYHLMTGEAAVDVLARVSAIVAGRPDPLRPASAINPEVPEEVGAILSAALSLNAENRFESARAMSTALEHVISTTAADKVRLQDSLKPSAVAAAVVAPSGAVAVAAAAAPVTVDHRFEQEFDMTEPGHYETVPASEDVDTDTGRISPSVSLDSIPPAVGKDIPRSPALLAPTRSGAGRSSYAVWLPILLVCLALVLFGAYRGLTGDDSESTSEVAASGSEPIEAIEAAPPAVETASQDPGTSTNEASAPTRKNGGVVDQRRNPTATSANPSGQDRASTVAAGVRVDDPEPQTRVAERRSQTQKAAERPARRVVRPAFEQPSVSSIEMIMTGIPEGRRRGADGRDELTEDELRERRRIRRMRRNAQPF